MRPVRTTLLAVLLALSAGVALAAVPQGYAQGSDVGIVQLNCDGAPEVVAVQNRGTEAQAMTGWRLESDRPEDGRFDLSTAGVLDAGESVFVQSGPGAGGLFRWSTQPVFRDGDPSDYARIVDGAGTVVQQVNCAGAPAPSPTPAADVPNGGGLPPPGDGAVSPAATALVGGLIMVLGVVASYFGWPRGLAVSARPRPAAPEDVIAGAGAGAGAAVLVLAVAAVVAALAFVAWGRRR